MTSQAEAALREFDSRGETAALRRIIELFQESPGLILPDGSAVACDPATGVYRFIRPEGPESRRPNPPAIFVWPDAETVVESMLLQLETQATPEGLELPSRGDDPNLTFEEAGALCPRLPEYLQLEIDCCDPPDSLWESLDDQTQTMAEQLAQRLTPQERDRLTTVLLERRLADDPGLKPAHRNRLTEALQERRRAAEARPE